MEPPVVLWSWLLGLFEEVVDWKERGWPSTSQLDEKERLAPGKRKVKAALVGNERWGGKEYA